MTEMKILIVLAGSPPSKELLEREINAADFVLAVDGGFNAFNEYQLQPDLILGDMDSANIDEISSTEVLNISDQELTDLQKTLDYVFRTHPVKSLIFLGAGGARTDHLLHNLHICASIDPSIRVQFINEVPVDGDFSIENIQRITSHCHFSLSVKSGAILSVLPITEYTGLTSKGLKWEISNQDRSHGFISQSNLVIKDDPRFNIEHGVAYITVYQ